MSNATEIDHTPHSSVLDYNLQFFSTPFIIAIVSILIISGVIGDILLIAATLYDPQLRLTGNALHLTLAILDILSLLNFALAMSNVESKHAGKDVIAGMTCSIYSLTHLWSMLLISAICIVQIARFRNPLFIITKRATVYIIVFTMLPPSAMVLFRMLSKMAPAFETICGSEAIYFNVIPRWVTALTWRTIFGVSLILIGTTFFLSMYHLKRGLRERSRARTINQSTFVINTLGVQFEIYPTPIDLSPIRRVYTSSAHHLNVDKLFTCCILLAGWILTVFVPFLLIFFTQKPWPLLIVMLFNVSKPILYCIRQPILKRRLCSLYR